MVDSQLKQTCSYYNAMSLFFLLYLLKQQIDDFLAMVLVLPK